MILQNNLKPELRINYLSLKIRKHILENYIYMNTDVNYRK